MKDRFWFLVGLLVLSSAKSLCAGETPDPAPVEKRTKSGNFVIEELAPDSRGSPGIRFFQKSDGKTVFEAINPEGGFIGDGCISPDGKFLAYAIGGGSAGHECVLLARTRSGGYEEVSFDFTESMVAALKDAGLIPKEANGCHEYATPVKIENGEMILRLRGNYSKDGKQHSYPATALVFSLADKKISVREK